MRGLHGVNEKATGGGLIFYWEHTPIRIINGIRRTNAHSCVLLYVCTFCIWWILVVDVEPEALAGGLDIESSKEKATSIYTTRGIAEGDEYPQTMI